MNKDEIKVIQENFIIVSRIIDKYYTYMKRNVHTWDERDSSAKFIKQNKYALIYLADLQLNIYLGQDWDYAFKDHSPNYFNSIKIYKIVTQFSYHRDTPDEIEKVILFEEDCTKFYWPDLALKIIDVFFTAEKEYLKEIFYRELVFPIKKDANASLELSED